ncbi:MAG TPA: hypothetical protein VGL66_11710 [Caulobacteraceae bacterium]|jgi:hypothetical protein
MCILKRTAVGGLSLLALALAAPATSFGQPTAPAAAQTTADPDAAERTALGREFAGLLLGSLDFRAQTIRKLQNNASTATLMRLRPDWSDLYLKTADETVQEELPVAQAVMGDALAASISVDELRVGVAFFKTQSGAELLHAMTQSTEGQTVTPFSDRAKKEIAAFSATPKGAGFMKHLADSSKLMEPLAAKTDGVTVGKFLRAFGGKSEAIEKTRLSGSSPATEAQSLGARLVRTTHYMDGYEDGMTRGIEKGIAKHEGEVDANLLQTLGASMKDAVVLDEGEVVRSIGNSVAKAYTLEELRAAVPFLESSTGQVFIAEQRDKAAGRKSRTLTQSQILVINRFAATKAGASFFKKGDLLDRAAQDAQNDYLPLILATSLRLSGERVLKSLGAT